MVVRRVSHEHDVVFDATANPGLPVSLNWTDIDKCGAGSQNGVGLAVVDENSIGLNTGVNQPPLMASSTSFGVGK
jgi:hypothetical protein